jgi:hypothetical protein
MQGTKIAPVDNSSLDMVLYLVGIIYTELSKLVGLLRTKSIILEMGINYLNPFQGGFIWVVKRLLVTKKSIKAWFPENEHYDSIIVNQPSKF